MSVCNINAKMQKIAKCEVVYRQLPLGRRPCWRGLRREEIKWGL